VKIEDKWIEKTRNRLSEEGKTKTKIRSTGAND
jgi:hypothetical protein